MSQITKLSTNIETYESEGSEDYIKAAQIKILKTLTNSKENYREYSNPDEVYSVVVEYANYIDEIITELNDRETATIDGGTF